MSDQQWIEHLATEGYTQVQSCSNGPNTEFPEHTHDQPTVHVITQGEFHLIDEHGKRILGIGERFEIPAGTTHRAKCGPDGCTFIVGVKQIT